MFKVGERVRARRPDNPRWTVANAVHAESDFVDCVGVIVSEVRGADYSKEDGCYNVDFNGKEDVVSGVYLDLVESATPADDMPPRDRETLAAINTPTLRDQFAMAALTGLCADPTDDDGPDGETSNELSYRYAVASYRFADAMLKVRNGGAK